MICCWCERADEGAVVLNEEGAATDEKPAVIFESAPKLIEERAQMDPTGPVEETELKPGPQETELKPDGPDPSKSSLKLTFKRNVAGDDSLTSFVFTERPLCIQWEREAPITVLRFTKAGSTAEAMGVTIGMVLATIDDDDVTSMPYAETFDVIKKKIALLPSEAPVVSLWLREFHENGSTSRLSFTLMQKPLGLKWDPRMPIVIRRVTKGSVGEVQGVKVGMELLTINGKELDSLSYEEAFRLMLDGLQSLPLTETISPNVTVMVESHSVRKYEVVSELQPGSAVLTDREYVFEDIGSFTPARGFLYIRCANDDKNEPCESLIFTLKTPFAVAVYLIYYGSGASEHTSKRPWIYEEGWTVQESETVPTLNLPRHNIHTREVRAKKFPAGRVGIKGNNGGDRAVPIVFVKPCRDDFQLEGSPEKLPPGSEDSEWF